MEDNLISSFDKISHFISPEILHEIRESFLQKYGLGICIYDCLAAPLTLPSNNLPSLAHLDVEEKEWFRIFFNIKEELANLPRGPQEALTQQFANGLIVRSIFSIIMDGELFVYACIVDVRRFIEKENDAVFLDDLKKINQTQTSVKILIDEEPSVVSGDYLHWNQELRKVLQLFLEAGKARAHIDNLVEASAPVAESSIADAKTGILFCSANGIIIEALPDAAELLGYNAPEDLCDLNFLNDLVVDADNLEHLRTMIDSKKSDPAAAVLFRKDESRIDVTLQFIPQQAGDLLIGFECQLVAQQTPQLDNVQEYEKDQTAIGLIAERRGESDEFELGDNLHDFDIYQKSRAPQKKYHGVGGKPSDGAEMEKSTPSALAGISHLLDASATPMFLVDAADRIQFWNGAMTNILGLPAKSVLKKDVSNFLVTNIKTTWQRWRAKLLP